MKIASYLTTEHMAEIIRGTWPTTTVPFNDFPFCSIEFPNGSDHAVIACYLEVYEEGEVKHINGV